MSRPPSLLQSVQGRALLPTKNVPIHGTRRGGHQGVAFLPSQRSTVIAEHTSNLNSKVTPSPATFDGRQSSGSGASTSSNSISNAASNRARAVLLSKHIASVQTVKQLAALYHAHREDLDHLHVSAMLGKLPHISGMVTSQPRTCSQLASKLLNALLTDFRAHLWSGKYSTRHLANCAWAIGRMKQQQHRGFVLMLAKVILRSLGPGSSGPGRPGTMNGAAAYIQQQPVALNGHVNQSAPLTAPQSSHEASASVDAGGGSDPQVQVPKLVSTACNSQDVSNMALALALLHAGDGQVWTALAARAMRVLRSSKSQELASIAWAFAEASFCDPDLFAALAQAVEAMPGKHFSAQHVSMLTWAFAVARYSSPSLMHKLRGAAILRLNATAARRPKRTHDAAAAAAAADDDDDDVQQVTSGRQQQVQQQQKGNQVDTFTRQGVVNVLWACATLQYAEPVLVSQLAATAVKLGLGSFSAQGLSNMAWALSKLGYSDRRLLQGIAKIATRRMARMQPLGIATIAQACLRACIDCRELLAASRPRVLALLPAFTPRTLTALLRVYSTLDASGSRGMFIAAAEALSGRVSALSDADCLMLLVSYARARVYNAPLYAGLCARVAPLIGGMEPSRVCQLASVLAASKRVSGLPALPIELCSALTQRCKDVAGAASAPAVLGLMWSMALLQCPLSYATLEQAFTSVFARVGVSHRSTTAQWSALALRMDSRWLSRMAFLLAHIALSGSGGSSSSSSTTALGGWAAVTAAAADRAYAASVVDLMLLSEATAKAQAVLTATAGVASGAGVSSSGGSGGQESESAEQKDCLQQVIGPCRDSTDGASISSLGGGDKQAAAQAQRSAARAVQHASEAIASELQKRLPLVPPSTLITFLHSLAATSSLTAPLRSSAGSLLLRVAQGCLGQRRQRLSGKALCSLLLTCHTLRLCSNETLRGMTRALASSRTLLNIDRVSAAQLLAASGPDAAVPVPQGRSAALVAPPAVDADAGVDGAASATTSGTASSLEPAAQVKLLPLQRPQRRLRLGDPARARALDPAASQPGSSQEGGTHDASVSRTSSPASSPATRALAEKGAILVGAQVHAFLDAAAVAVLQRRLQRLDGVAQARPRVRLLRAWPGKRTPAAQQNVRAQMPRRSAAAAQWGLPPSSKSRHLPGRQAVFTSCLHHQAAADQHGHPAAINGANGAMHGRPNGIDGSAKLHAHVNGRLQHHVNGHYPHHEGSMGSEAVPGHVNVNVNGSSSSLASSSDSSPSWHHDLALMGPHDVHDVHGGAPTAELGLFEMGERRQLPPRSRAAIST